MLKQKGFKQMNFKDYGLKYFPGNAMNPAKVNKGWNFL